MRTRISVQLWSDSMGLAHESLRTPFVIRLSDGTLERCSFLHYLGQDTFYRLAYADAFKAALRLCRPEDEHLALRLRTALVQAEQSCVLHMQRAAGFDLSLCKPEPATLAYTDFLQATHSHPDATLADIMSATIPCARLYAWIGHVLLPKQMDSSNPYMEWIENYSRKYDDRRFQDLEAILDETFVPECYDRVSYLYSEAMRLEREFFAAQPLTGGECPTTHTLKRHPKPARAGLNAHCSAL
ncbi:THI1B [Auxenochlorella protothecoides x Auxenochlorella symbiontica]